MPQTDSVASARPSDGSVSASAFQRAYKGRKRKTKCNITAEEYSSGSPCARCRREMRECVFPAQRYGRRHSAGGSRPRGQPRRSSAGDSQQFVSDATEQTFEGYASPPPTTRLSVSTAANQQGHGTPPDGLHQGVQPSSDLMVADSMMRTVVSNGHDALNLLFQAANHEGQSDSQSPGSRHPHGAGRTPQSSIGNFSAAACTSSPAVSVPMSMNVASVGTTSDHNTDVLEIWSAFRFVRMGWLSAQEAVTFVDLFFQNISPLSPVLDDFYSDHANHFDLVTREPLLGCMILTISSRYHTLPTTGGQSRGYLLHQRLWDHCQHILMRLLLGQEKNSKAKTRTLGSIEALILMTEWHPRALQVPPVSDGWDSDMILSFPDVRDQNGAVVDNPSRDRWLEDVIQPAQRSDRMSRTILGMAMSLANELGVFDQNEDPDPGSLSPYEIRQYHRRKALAKLLFLYQEQLSSRLGCKSLMPESVSHGISSSSTSRMSFAKRGEDWNSFMIASTELTKMVRSISDVLFPSQAITSQLLRSGRYIGIIEHFRLSLSGWEEKHLKGFGANTYFHDLLTVEYQNTQVYANSLGLQAVVQRTLAGSEAGSTASQIEISPIDYSFIQAVVDGCLQTLKIASSLSQRNILKYAPVGMFLRITTASVFLLKALAIGVSATRLRRSLDTLTRAISALRSSAPDDLHLCGRYATLLETSLNRLHDSFVPSSRPPSFATRPPSAEREGGTAAGSAGAEADPGGGVVFQGEMGQLPGLDCEAMGGMLDDGDDSWLSLPLDPSMVPFGMDASNGFQWLGDDSLDFIFSLADRKG